MIYTYNELLKSFCWNSLRILVTVTQFLRRLEELLHPQFSKTLSQYFNQAKVYSTFWNHHSFLLSCSVVQVITNWLYNTVAHTLWSTQCCLREKLPFPSHELQTGIPCCKRKRNPIKYTFLFFYMMSFFVWNSRGWYFSVRCLLCL